MAFLSCRAWLPLTAESLGISVGITDRRVLMASSHEAAAMAVKLIRLAPWHLRWLLFLVECAASFWRLAYRLNFLRGADPQKEIKAFEKMPLISAPLLKLYRSLIALSWFELPDVQAALASGDPIQPAGSVVTNEYVPL